MIVTKWARTVFLIAILFVSFGMSIFIERGLQTGVLAETEGYEDLKVFAEVLSTVQKNYVEPVKSKELVYGAIKGMMHALDAHSAYMSPDVYKEVQVDTKGEFGGLGLQIGMKDNKMVVIAPIEGTPADQAGIRPGDIILRVDDHPLTKEMDLMDAINKMRGVPGSKVSLTIQREQVQGPIVFNLVRDLIRIKSVKSKVLDSDIGYIRVTQFQEQTAGDLAREISKLRGINVRSLILDLRNNPGGLLTSAVDVTGQFLEKGHLIVTVKGRSEKKEEYLSKNPGPLRGVPLVILVNEGSASASEIVSGALQDWGKAVILGVPTFGKGSVQTILPLSDGSALRLTTAKYYTPHGRSIQNKGIDPDVLVKLAGAKEARPVIREKDLDRHMQNEEPALEKEKAVQSAESPSNSNGVLSAKGEDIQLKVAIELLKSGKVFEFLSPKRAVQRNG